MRAKMSVTVYVYDMDRTMDAANIVESFDLDVTNVRVCDESYFMERNIPISCEKDVNGEYAILDTWSGEKLILPNSNLEVVSNYGVENMRYIALYSHTTPKRQRLVRAAQMLNDKLSGTPETVFFYSSMTWYDYGQHWAWNTVLKRDSNSICGDCQFFCPTDQREVLY